MFFRLRFLNLRFSSHSSAPLMAISTSLTLWEKPLQVDQFMPVAKDVVFLLCQLTPLRLLPWHPAYLNQ
jgi:hypothetical protein